MMSVDEILYGTVFLLSRDFSPEYMEEHVAKMRALNMNTVVVWPPVFFEGEQLLFEPHRQFLDIAHRHGMKVIVELTGQVSNLEYFPDYMYSDDVAVRNLDGTVSKMQNGLGELNYNHPRVKQQIREVFAAVVDALKDHPALLGWDVWNETHFKSYDEITLGEFQKWLKEKYQQIEELNRIWMKSYTTFEQIRFDPVMWASIMPDVDWELFRTDNLAGILAEFVSYIRAVDSIHPVIADNVMANTVWSEFDRGTDDAKVAAEVDRYGISFYPKTGGRLLEKNEPWLRALTFDAAAAAGGGRFFVSEMQSHYYSEIFTQERVSPEDVALWCMEAFSRGCDGVVYWKWAPFHQGFQVGGRGLVQADGTLSSRARMAGVVGSFLKEHPAVLSGKRSRDVGVLLDRENHFMVKAINNRVNHLIGSDHPVKALFGLYQTCFKNNLPLDVIERNQLAEKLQGLEVLFLPYQVRMEQEMASVVRQFVQNGGRVIVNYPFSDVDSEGMLFSQLPGGPLNDLLGLKHVDNLELQDAVVELRSGKFFKLDSPFEIQVVEPDPTVDIIASVGGYPLITEKVFGRGSVVYIASDVWNRVAELSDVDLGDELLNLLCSKPLAGRKVISDVPVILLESEAQGYLFVFNEQQDEIISVSFLACDRQPTLVFGEARVEWVPGRMSIHGNSCVYVFKI